LDRKNEKKGKILMKVNKVLVAGLAAVFGLTAWVTGVGATGAQKDTDTTVEVVVDGSLVISSDGLVHIEVLPTAGGTLAVGADHVKVSTNDTAGYKLYIKDKDSSTVLSSGTTTNDIPAGGGTVGAPAALSVSSDDAQWGFRLNSFGTNLFAKVTATDVEIGGNTAGITDHETVVTYGVLAKTGQANGIYTDIVTYTAVNQT
jgi:hypothetical protein